MRSRKARINGSAEVRELPPIAWNTEELRDSARRVEIEESEVYAWVMADEEYQWWEQVQSGYEYCEANGMQVDSLEEYIHYSLI